MSDIDDSIDSIDSMDNEKYEISPYPINTPDKVGITIKGSSEPYVIAHKIVTDTMSEKGNRYLINGVEICILDAPKNKSINVEVKAGKAMSGKANLKIYGVNKGGFATIMITKPKGIDYEYSKILAFRVFKFLLDGLMEETISVKDIQEMKRKKKDDKRKIVKLNCEVCEKKFLNMQGLKIHKTKFHGSKQNEEQKMEVEESMSNEEKHVNFIDKESINENVMEIDIDIDEESVKRAKLHDEKVVKKQMKLEEEEIR